MRNLIVFLIIIFVFSLLFIGCANATEVFYGNWIVSREIAFSTVVAITENEVKELIGKKAVYLDDIAQFNNIVLNNPKYRKETVSSGDFLTGERIPLIKLGIKEKIVTKIEINDSKNQLWDSPGSTFYIKNKDSLIFNYEGVYFELKRSK